MVPRLEALVTWWQCISRSPPGPAHLPVPLHPFGSRDVGRCERVLLAHEVHARDDAEDPLPAPRVGRQERSPNGPVILASNHLSFSDHFFGPLPVPRKVIFLAKSEYFTGRGLKGLISKIFFTGVGQIPLDRAGGPASEQAIRTGLGVLAAGHVLGIYPEGTRSPDGRLYRGKTGVARLAVESGAPVVPCAMIDTFQFQPPGTLWPNPRFRPGVRFGEPLDFSRYHGQEADGRCCGPSPTRSCRRSRAFRPGIRRHRRPPRQGRTGRRSG